AEVVAVGDGQRVVLGEGGGGDQLVEVEVAGTRVGVAVDHHVEVDRVAQVDVVADEAVDLGVRVARAEVHARTPDAGVETGSRGVGEAGLQGGILVGLRDATPDVIGNGGHFPGERRLLLRGRDERDGGQQDG